MPGGFRWRTEESSMCLMPREVGSGEGEGGGQRQRDVYSGRFQRNRHAGYLLEINACERKTGEQIGQRKKLNYDMAPITSNPVLSSGANCAHQSQTSFQCLKEKEHSDTCSRCSEGHYSQQPGWKPPCVHQQMHGSTKCGTSMQRNLIQP